MPTPLRPGPRPGPRRTPVPSSIHPPPVAPCSFLHRRAGSRTGRTSPRRGRPSGRRERPPVTLRCSPRHSLRVRCCWRSTAVNRALGAATMGVALLSPVALSACSAGQVTQTATQERDKVGAMAKVGDITLRQIEIAYPRGGRYDAGDDADLTLAIVNTGEEPDTLVSVDGEGFS